MPVTACCASCFVKYEQYFLRHPKEYIRVNSNALNKNVTCSYKNCSSTDIVRVSVSKFFWIRKDGFCLNCYGTGPFSPQKLHYTAHCEKCGVLDATYI